jgi:hypothetical protein
LIKCNKIGFKQKAYQGINKKEFFNRKVSSSKSKVDQKLSYQDEFIVIVKDK